MRVRKDTTSSTSRTARVTLAKKHYLKYPKDRSRYTIFDEKTTFFSSRIKGTARSASHLPDSRIPAKPGETRRYPAGFSERHAPLLRGQTGHLGAKNGT